MYVRMYNSFACCQLLRSTYYTYIPLADVIARAENDRARGNLWGGYSFVACLSHLTIDHASLSRRGWARRRMLCFAEQHSRAQCRVACVALIRSSLPAELTSSSSIMHHGQQYPLPALVLWSPTFTALRYRRCCKQASYAPYSPTIQGPVP